MISKVHLNKVACFKQAATLVTDKKVNLIYGLNGTGKSTFSNLFYKSGDVKYKDCSLEGLNNDELIVYNQLFIHEQFYEAENLEGIFTLSKTNKDAEIKISNAEKEIKRIDIEIIKKGDGLEKAKANIEAKRLAAKNKVWEIKTNYSGGDRVLEFCLEGYKSDGYKLLDYIESLQNPITRPRKTTDELKEDVQALSGGNAQKYNIFAKITFNAHHVENDALLQKKIVGNENSSVGDLIDKLGNSDWVKDGLKYLPNEIESKIECCPFCQEKTISQDLYISIKEYFDEAYESDLNKLKLLKKEYSEAISSIPDKSAFDSNPKFESFKKDFEINYISLLKILSSNEKLLEEKVKSPSLTVLLESSQTAIERIVEIINNVNKLTEDHNKRIDNKASAMIELRSLFWQIMRFDFDQTISSLISDKKDSEINIRTIRKGIETLQNDIKQQENIIIEQQKQTVNIDEAIGSINNGLVDLGIDDFKIIKHSDGLYRIARADVNLRIFHSLSEGEKMIISFLYFLELCRGKKNATDAGNKKIIVIDDPISSLSHIFVFNVGRLIHNEFLRSDKYEQIFILTHSLYFFYELTDTNHEKRKENQKLFRIRKNASGSDIIEMKYEEIQNDYHSYWFIIKDDKQPPCLISNCMRNIIEYFFAFVEKRDLNNVFQKAEFQNNRFSAFNRYINRESHSLGQNIFDIKEFNYSDFKEAFQLVFKVSGYEDHYLKMIK